MLMGITWGLRRGRMVGVTRRRAMFDFMGAGGICYTASWHCALRKSRAATRCPDICKGSGSCDQVQCSPLPGQVVGNFGNIQVNEVPSGSTAIILALETAALPFGKASQDAPVSPA